MLLRALSSNRIIFAFYSYLKNSPKGYVDHALYRDPKGLPEFPRTKDDVYKCINGYHRVDQHGGFDYQYPLLVIRSYIELKEDRGDSAKVVEEKLRALELLMPHHVEAFATLRKEKGWPPSPVLPMDWHWIKFTRTSWGPTGLEPWVPDRQVRRHAWHEVKEDDGPDYDGDDADEVGDEEDDSISTADPMTVG
ncbi:hypothetical protein Q8F55_008194 [Vanrija albida]|uniref:Uncharacterized protein n=1 Tax=Vanrija albida TaxID=181172 RepID=A0ABR3PVR7_9TREE